MSEEINEEVVVEEVEEVVSEEAEEVVAEEEVVEEVEN